jgi:hypothetical protein
MLDSGRNPTPFATLFKKGGVITIDKLLHAGPVNGFRRR